METLSRMLSLDEKVIRVWFQNKRSREKNPKNDFRHPTTTTTTGSISMWNPFLSSSSPNFHH